MAVLLFFLGARIQPEAHELALLWAEDPPGLGRRDKERHMSIVTAGRASGCGCAGPDASEPRRVESREASLGRRLSEGRQSFLRFFRRRLARPEDAEDALQDFCVKVLRSADRLADDTRIDAWIGRILRNTLIDYYRRRGAWARAETAYGQEMDGAVAEQHSTEAAGCPCVHRALRTLRLEYSEILTRADLQAEPRERIATELGLTTNNIGVRLYRARRALRRILETVCGHCGERRSEGCDCPQMRHEPDASTCGQSVA